MGCNYYIVDSMYGRENLYNIKDDSGTCLFHYCLNDKTENHIFELLDSENRELIVTVKDETNLGKDIYSIFDSRGRKIFDVFKDYYFTNLIIKGIFGDFTVNRTVKHKRNFEICKNGLNIADILEMNKFSDNHLSLTINKDDFSLVAIITYILIDVNKILGVN